MTWSTDCSSVRCSSVRESWCSIASRATSAKTGRAPATDSANPSRRTEANHSGHALAGCPTATKRAASGERSDRVSLTSKTITEGLMHCQCPAPAYASPRTPGRTLVTRR